MKFLKSKKNNNRLFLFVTALDQSVIARPNFKVKEDCWKDLPEFTLTEELENNYLINTPVFVHLQNLLEEKKYKFLCDSHKEKENIVETLGNLQLPTIYFKELEWLKRFGYYYHHSLAISVILAKFGAEIKLEEKFLNRLLKAALIHDIGITRLPYNVLFSHELFHEDDKLIMQQHTLISHLLISYYSKQKEKSLGLIALNHHSPDKFCEFDEKESENRTADITWMIHNMDVFDALISNRPFRPAYKIESALLYLKQVNRSLQLPLDIVHWLERKYELQRVDFQNDYFIPYHPELQSQQLN